MALLSIDVDPTAGGVQRRRIGCYVMTGDAFVRLFRQGSQHCFRVLEGLPKDAVLVGGEYVPSRQAVLLYYASEEFDAGWEGLASQAEWPITLDHEVIHGDNGKAPAD